LLIINVNSRTTERKERVIIEIINIEDRAKIACFIVLVIVGVLGGELSPLLLLLYQKYQKTTQKQLK